MVRSISTLFLLFVACQVLSQSTGGVYFKTDRTIEVGASRLDEYLYDCQERNVAVVANQSSLVNGTHLVDTLLSRGVNLVKVFSPEHGFRGTADAGKKVGSKRDEKTGLKIVSLYGRNKKPTYDQMIDVDVVLFDLQDVGVRFYTYISTMSLMMEACAELNKKMIILDRPNPNGHYVDGPILNPEFSSFIGMHQIPIVHGMTVGEYASMVNEEAWLKGGVKCDLKVITCNNYDHNDYYKLPVKPSPNLPNMSSIFLYPSLCLFEGTVVSIGRGTEKPFQLVGHPDYAHGDTLFVPESRSGATKPKLQDKVCKGFDLENFGWNDMPKRGELYLHWLLNFHEELKDSTQFFLENGFFDLLAGSDQLRNQIIEGKKENEIRESWSEGLKKFKLIRRKYLLYEDFE